MAPHPTPYPMNLSPNFSKIEKVLKQLAKGGKLSNPTPEFGARFAIVAPERIAGRSDRLALFDTTTDRVFSGIYF